MPDVTTIGISNRCLTRHVGGNTTYVRAITTGIRDHVHVIGLDRLSRLPWPAAEAFWHPVKARDCDVLWYPTDTGALPGTHPNIVATIHGCASLHVNGIRTPVNEQIWRTRVRLTAKAANRIITVTHTAKADVVALTRVDPGRIHVIRHGIDHTRYHPHPEPGDRTHLENIFDGNVPDRYVLYLGMIDPKKNVDGILDAVHHLDKDVTVVIAGKPAWGTEATMHRIRELTRTGQIRYLGFVDDNIVPALYRAATVFCFPSHYEGFGLPVLEAQASGTPVVCTTNGSLGEISAGTTETCGSTGESIAAAITRALNPSRRTELIEAGLVNASRYRWETSINEHLNVFNERRRTR